MSGGPPRPLPRQSLAPEVLRAAVLGVVAFYGGLGLLLLAARWAWHLLR